MEKIFCDGTRLVDEHGRQRIFRGMNICFKTRKEYNIETHDKLIGIVKRIIVYCKECGFNMVRLGFNWFAVEPDKNVFDEKFIAFLKEIGKLLEENEIYFFLDMHQDVWGKAFNNGAPLWATHTDGKEPKKHLFIWPEGYFYMSALTNAFHHFWNNDFGLLDDYKKMWLHIINEFSDNNALIGYDFINEPYPTPNGRKVFLKIIENVFYELDGKRIDYSYLYESKHERAAFVKMILKIALRVKTVGRMKKVLARIENKDVWQNAVLQCEEFTKDFDKGLYTDFLKQMNMISGNRLQLIEHTYYNNMGVPFSADFPKNENCIYSPHGYDIWVDTPMYKKASNNRVDVIFEQCRKNQERLGVPVIVGEWGAGAKGDEWYPHIEHLLDMFDNYQWSYTYWGIDLKSKKFMNLLIRPYPVAVNGRIISYSYTNGHFRLEFEQENDNNIETLIYDTDTLKHFNTGKGINVIEFDVENKKI